MNYFKQRHIPFYYLYNTKGSEIYNEITQLDEYYPFKKEQELLNKFVSEILAIKDGLKTDKITLVEFGAGYSEKTEVIISNLLKKYSNVTFVPIDVSESACKYSQEKYSSFKNLIVEPFYGTYDAYLENHFSFSNRVIYLWLGSSIGNLEEKDQIAFLQRVSDSLSYRDFFLVGFDTVYKDSKIIQNAYNDDKGVSAKFILNILTHLKEKYNLSLNEEDFEYEGNWNNSEERMEMYLKCKRDTSVKDPKEKIEFKKDDKILVEYSSKFSLEKIEKLANKSNLIISNIWMTDDRYHTMAQFIKNTNNLWKLTDRIFKEFITYENLLIKPIDLRNLFIFYLGHIYVFFDIKVFGLEKEDKDNYFELFERGRDPLVDENENCHRHSRVDVIYPQYEIILEYNEKIRSKISEHLKSKGMTFNLLCSIEHEIMHQETLFYMIRMTDCNLPLSDGALISATIPERKVIEIPKRKIVQGSNETFVWDNESPQHEVEVDAFKVENLPVTWNDMKEFLQEPNHSDYLLKDKIINLNEKMQIRISSSVWLDFEQGKNLPAWVTLEVARMYVDWKCSKGLRCRIMTENEFDSLSSTLNNLKKGNVNFKNFHALPVGYYNDCSNDGVYELFGNGWELTNTLFRPFENFKPLEIYSEYSNDFFTEKHFVLKGASPFTGDDICRKSFRNWFQYNYAYHTSKFRLVYY